MDICECYRRILSLGMLTTLERCYGALTFIGASGIFIQALHFRFCVPDTFTFKYFHYFKYIILGISTNGYDKRDHKHHYIYIYFVGRNSHRATHRLLQCNHRLLLRGGGATDPWVQLPRVAFVISFLPLDWLCFCDKVFLLHDYNNNNDIRSNIINFFIIIQMQFNIRLAINIFCNNSDTQLAIHTANTQRPSPDKFCRKDVFHTFWPPGPTENFFLVVYSRFLFTFYHISMRYFLFTIFVTISTPQYI